MICMNVKALTINDKVQLESSIASCIHTPITFEGEEVKDAEEEKGVFYRYLKNLVFHGYNKVYFNNIDIDRVIKINEVKNLEIDGISLFFNNVTFNREFTIIGSKNISIKFEKCIFEDKVTLAECVFNDFVEFSDVIFNVEVSLLLVHFMKGISFDKRNSTSIFKGKTEFRGLELMLLACSADFKNDFLFANTNCSGPIVFRKSIFEGKIEISDLKINNNSNVYFDDICFNDLLISYTIFPNILSLCDAKISSIKIDHTYFEKVPLFMAGSTIMAADRETARFLKNEAYKVNDIVLALQFKAQEMSLYRKELKSKKNEIKGFRKRVDYLGERALLCLNTYSNNNSTSWLRGLGFTLSVWFIFFSIFVMLKDGFGTTFIWGDRDYWKEAFKFFWNYFGIFKDFNDLDFNIPVWRLISSIIFYFFGKIGIAYGVYQTIAAFRKYRK